jgi:hypothetical protein
VQAAKDATLIPLSFNGEAIDQNLADLVLHDKPDVLQTLKCAPFCPSLTWTVVGCEFVMLPCFAPLLVKCGGGGNDVAGRGCDAASEDEEDGGAAGVDVHEYVYDGGVHGGSRTS